MKPRVLVLEKNRIISDQVSCGGENVSTYNRDDIYAIEKCKDYYLIWITHQQMIYLPKTIFASPDDIKTFETEILPAYKELKRSLKPGFLYLMLIMASVIVFLWLVRR